MEFLNRRKFELCACPTRRGMVMQGRGDDSNRDSVMVCVLVFQVAAPILKSSRAG